MSEVALGTLYELNKGAFKDAKALNVKKEIKRLNKELFSFFANHSYFMLLCNDLKDYTVFALTSSAPRQVQINEAKEGLIDCLRNRGELLSIDKTEDGIAFEIWLRIEEEIYVYYFFPYDDAIIVC